ncbi:hypothetical protein [Streptomyces sp. P9-2]|uniref:hypothetical protein n=1 Tax=Streptomyces sp. P9-2 TaxID=3423201 RepID=UPI003F7435EB
MSERMKPPTRRTGRTLGGAKKTAPPPPPPAAELTPEQYAAEQATAQSEGRPATSEPQAQPAPSTIPAEASAQGRTEAVPEVTRTSAQPTGDVAPSGPVQAEAVSQPVGPAVTPQERLESAAEPTVQTTQPGEPVARHGHTHVTSTPSGAAPPTEVAIRPAAPPAAGGTAFPVRTDVTYSHREQDMRSQETPSQGTSWARGPGRPKDIPETAVVLNQRIIARESLDSSVPAALKLKKRIKRFALDNELDHLPIGDIVSVALDEWLTARGF